jgi:hypothetical protein
MLNQTTTIDAFYARKSGRLHQAMWRRASSITSHTAMYNDLIDGASG